MNEPESARLIVSVARFEGRQGQEWHLYRRQTAERSYALNHLFVRPEGHYPVICNVLGQSFAYRDYSSSSEWIAF